jgi:hypothetical protein
MIHWGLSKNNVGKIYGNQVYKLWTKVWQYLDLREINEHGSEEKLILSIMLLTFHLVLLGWLY